MDERELESAVRGLGEADAAGHRVVHGGTRFTGPVVIDDATLKELDDLTALAPLHQPTALELIRLLRRLRPDLAAVACVDTAFHATLPPWAYTYPVPVDWRERLGVRRFGFHGLSHAWASRRAAQLVGRDARELRIVTCHLGAGASLAAVRGGESVDTTMGFTPLDGLVMATRSGALDPGLVTWLTTSAGIAAGDVEDQLNHASGVLGLAGTADMKTVTEQARAGRPDALLALDVYVHRLCAEVAAMTAALGGLDVLVFTGGVGERSADVRERAAAGVSFLGVSIDAAANAAADGDVEITAAGAAVRTLVVVAREDLEIAHLTRVALGGD